MGSWGSSHGQGKFSEDVTVPSVSYDLRCQKVQLRKGECASLWDCGLCRRAGGELCVRKALGKTGTSTVQWHAGSLKSATHTSQRDLLGEREPFRPQSQQQLRGGNTTGFRVYLKVSQHPWSIYAESCRKRLTGLRV